MAEYISREFMLKNLEADMMNNAEHCNPVTVQIMERFIKYVKEFPAADVQSVRHGRWTYPYKDKDINQCSECRSYVQDKISNVREMFAYCPFCGARMDGDTECQ